MKFQIGQKVKVVLPYLEGWMGSVLWANEVDDDVWEYEISGSPHAVQWPMKTGNRTHENFPLVWEEQITAL
jgi:hypothetical protein